MNGENVEIDELTPDMTLQFIELVKQQGAIEERQRDHYCWFFFPTKLEFERMQKYCGEPHQQWCPKCKERGKTGRLGVQLRKWEMGYGYHIVCTNWKNGCDFEEDITDD